MTSAAYVTDFIPSLGCLLARSIEELATQLETVADLNARERGIILTHTRDTLQTLLHGKLTRVLLLELNAARVAGKLAGGDPAQRWNDFIGASAQPEFWEQLHLHYPTLRARVDTIVRNRCAASLDFARRWAADRAELAPLCGAAAGELHDLSFGAGDSHCGGLTVALVRCAGGRVVYKPRPLGVDAALQTFVDELAVDHGHALDVRVPRVLPREDYGWAEFVEHRYAADDDELRAFYRGIGQWLAIMHLLGASDLHAENLIASGGVPVVVDCETLFTPKVTLPPSELGNALDRASELVAGTVLNIGLLPGRAQSLGWRGIDYSGMGSLPGQQPMMPQPAIVGAGTDEAHLGTTLVPVPIAQNHPSQQPALALFWPQALDAFKELTATLQRIDREGRLQPRLRAFADCRVRVVLRPTEVYAEIGRMLWHPVSLHDEAQARARGEGLLAKMAANVISAPSDPAVIRAEIDDLMIGDIPFFWTTVADGRLRGPGGTTWLEPGDLAEAALAHWRASDFAFEFNVIRAAMVSAYLNDGWSAHLGALQPSTVRSGDVDARRRALTARILRGLMSNAIRGDDGSVAWIAPVLGAAGWSVQPLAMDLYGGLSGVALLVGAYLRETAAGRAESIDGLDTLFEGVQHALRLAELKVDKNRRDSVKTRPPTPGIYIGLGSQIWTLLVLDHWKRGSGDELARARALAEGMFDAAAADDMNDLLTGKAGAIPALLALAEATNDSRYLAMACELGDRLVELAHHKDGYAYWVHEQMWPNGIGGYSHGVTGVGWALTKLARASGDARYADLAEAAFKFEDTLFDEEEQNWVDLRNLGGPKAAAVWCHGSAGIGLAHLDIDPELEAPRSRLLLRRAAAATAGTGIGWNHCLCHGDTSAWELLDRAIVLGEAPAGLTRDGLVEQLLSSLEEFGPSCGLTREVYVPGLLPGLGGVAYQLLRTHPDSDLPSVLTIGDLAKRAG